jgi:hypothetical protein
MTATLFKLRMNTLTTAVRATRSIGISRIEAAIIGAKRPHPRREECE